MILCIPKVYKRRDPQDTVLYQIVQNYLEDWLANYFLKHNEILPSYVENEYRDYFRCGILSHGFARAHCKCGADFIIAFSCKRRGVCPSCNTKHMIATATHIVSEVLPKLPIRQIRCNQLYTTFRFKSKPTPTLSFCCRGWYFL